MLITSSPRCSMFTKQCSAPWLMTCFLLGHHVLKVMFSLSGFRRNAEKYTAFGSAEQYHRSSWQEEDCSYEASLSGKARISTKTFNWVFQPVLTPEYTNSAFGREHSNNFVKTVKMNTGQSESQFKHSNVGHGPSCKQVGNHNITKLTNYVKSHLSTFCNSVSAATITVV